MRTIVLLATLVLLGTSLQGITPLAAETPSNDERFEVRDDILIKTPDGATLSATSVVPSVRSARLPTVLKFDIYAEPGRAVKDCELFVAHGYACVVGDVRGKRLSPDKVVPYEHDHRDAVIVIEWITRQPWSDGRVGMWGGSYSGFTAWAATKRLPPALKTIAVSAAAIPGIGLPMHNNIFLNANYGWAFYVTNNKYLDSATYNQRDRWRKSANDWFASGRKYRDFDAIDGTPNALLHRWLDHPSYDAYWQAMVPYREDFAKIDIPVLTITGYYDDGQISALRYTKQHYAHRSDAKHYVVIGPYDHLATHAANKPTPLRGYSLDPVAQFSTPALTLQWMDHVLRGREKPALLKKAINYQVMGANEWRHSDSLERIEAQRRRWYFSGQKSADGYLLRATKPPPTPALKQRVDLKDRVFWHNFHSYPFPIVQEPLDKVTELIFVGPRLDEPTIFSGAMAGELAITINKRDVDLGVVAMEEMSDGKLFHLAYSLGRASFARSHSQRSLLTPGQKTTIPFETSFVSRQLQAGSRLLVLLDVNKNPNAQINYGTGKDVSEESSMDADVPLEIQWHNDSFIDVPVEHPLR